MFKDLFTSLKEAYDNRIQSTFVIGLYYTEEAGSKDQIKELEKHFDELLYPYGIGWSNIRLEFKDNNFCIISGKLYSSNSETQRQLEDELRQRLMLEAWDGVIDSILYVKCIPDEDLQYYITECLAEYKDRRLCESSRAALISKSRSADNYANSEESRWTAKKNCSIANTVADYNKIDMNTFWKDDILKFKVKVKGINDTYLVTIEFNNILDNIQKAIKKNNNKLDYRCVYNSLIKSIGNSDVKVSCTCPDYKYRLKYWNSTHSDEAEDKETRKANITNPNDSKGAGCKHILAVLNNIEWLRKIASVIHNYINYCKDEMEYNYSKYMFPKLYGMSYDKAVQLTLRDYDSEGNLKDKLDSDESIINLSNALGKVRGRIKKGSNKNPVSKKEESLHESLYEKIVKKGNNYQVQSEKGRNLGTYDTKEEAEKRLKQVEYFKHLNEENTLNESLSLNEHFFNYNSNGQNGPELSLITHYKKHIKHLARAGITKIDGQPFDIKNITNPKTQELQDFLDVVYKWIFTPADLTQIDLNNETWDDSGYVLVYTKIFTLSKFGLRKNYLKVSYELVRRDRTRDYLIAPRTFFILDGGTESIQEKITFSTLPKSDVNEHLLNLDYSECNIRSVQGYNAQTIPFNDKITTQVSLDDENNSNKDNTDKEVSLADEIANYDNSVRNTHLDKLTKFRDPLLGDYNEDEDEINCRIYIVGANEEKAKASAFNLLKIINRARQGLNSNNKFNQLQNWKSRKIYNDNRILNLNDNSVQDNINKGFIIYYGTKMIYDGENPVKTLNIQDRDMIFVLTNQTIDINTISTSKPKKEDYIFENKTWEEKCQEYLFSDNNEVYIIPGKEGECMLTFYAERDFDSDIDYRIGRLFKYKNKIYLDPDPKIYTPELIDYINSGNSNNFNELFNGTFEDFCNDFGKDEYEKDLKAWNENEEGQNIISELKQKYEEGYRNFFTSTLDNRPDNFRFIITKDEEIGGEVTSRKLKGQRQEWDFKLLYNLGEPYTSANNVKLNIKIDVK